MKSFKYSIIVGAVGFCLLGSGVALAFSFSFDDDDYPGYGRAPYAAPGLVPQQQAWAPPAQYRPWVAPPPQYWQPRLPAYDRSVMKQGRQRGMGNFDDAMNELRAMLYGNADFDRTRAVQLTRKIEATSGQAMTGNFHPGSVATIGSRTSANLWGNEESFRANAEALKAAAGAFAEELGKRPTDAEGAIYLSQRSERFGHAGQRKEAPVSPQIWNKFNALSDTCVACHSAFRGPGW